MSALTAEQIDGIIETCRSNLDALTQSLNASFGSQCELAIGERSDGAEEIREQVPDEAGVLVAFQFDGVGLVCLIPESLPIPEWYRNPDESQASRLQTLAMEWSVAMVPPELEAVDFRTVPTANLREQLETCQLADDPAMFELLATSSADGDAPTTFQVVLPVSRPLAEGVGPGTPDSSAQSGQSDQAEQSPGTEQSDPTDQSPPPESAEDITPGPEPEPGAKAEAEREPEAEAEGEPEAEASNRQPDTAARQQVGQQVGQQRINRIRHVPVQMIVRIAQRKIGMRQLRNVSPGTLLTFDKSCDSLLDIYIGEKLYCRGEAVKVGENFGVKINECNRAVVRQRKVHKV